MTKMFWLWLWQPMWRLQRENIQRLISNVAGSLELLSSRWTGREIIWCLERLSVVHVFLSLLLVGPPWNSDFKNLKVLHQVSKSAATCVKVKYWLNSLTGVKVRKYRFWCVLHKYLRKEIVINKIIWTELTWGSALASGTLSTAVSLFFICFHMKLMFNSITCCETKQ